MTHNKTTDNRDFDDFFASYYRNFFTKDGVLYCNDIINKILLEWNGEDWEMRPFEPYNETHLSIALDEVRKIAAFPPWDAFDEIMRHRKDAYAAQMEEAMRTTPHRVIGYTNTDFGSDAFLPISAGDLSREQYAAVLKDFRAHGYFYSGQEYQDSCSDLTPVLDDYRYVEFSRRGFAALVAESLGDYSDMGYCGYTEAAFIEDEDRVYPVGGRYDDVPQAADRIEVDADTYAILAQEAAEPSGTLIAVLVPTDETRFYWENDEITLVCNEQKIEATVRTIGIFASKNWYDWLQDAREVRCSPWQEKYAGRTLLLVQPH